MSDIQEIYPFATQDGKAIPLDILKPSAFMQLAVSTAEEGYTFGDYRVASFLATEDCLLKFSDQAIGTIDEGVAIPNALFLPKGVLLISSIINPVIRARSMTAATAFIRVQFIEKWAGLGLERQYTRK